MASKWSIKTIGPTILKDNKHHGSCILEVASKACLDWLDKRDPRSIVYVSLGSIATLGEEQMVELASGLLMMSDYHFLWMVRASEECKLPTKFKSEISKKGLIMNWCPQLEALAHLAVPCFMTHSGWNSTIEALSSGVPMIAMPVMVDQTTNAKFVADVWQVGGRVKANDKGIVTALQEKKLKSALGKLLRVRGQRSIEGMLKCGKYWQKKLHLRVEAQIGIWMISSLKFQASSPGTQIYQITISVL